jgi:hypothetical protein
MRIEFNNGATVSRMYGSNSETELIAVFLWEQDAKDFAQSLLAKDVARNWFDSSYVVSDHSSGAIFVFRPQKPEVKAAA